MMNSYRKKRFCTSSIISNFFLFFFLFLTCAVHAQGSLRIHFVQTETGAELSPEQSIEIQQIARSYGVELSIDQYKHPRIGKLPSINYSDSIPFFSTDMRATRDGFFNSSHRRTKLDYYVFVSRKHDDSLHTGFAIPGKHIMFISLAPKNTFTNRFATYFLIAAADQQGKNKEALDSLSEQLGTKDSLQRRQDSYFLFHDETENLGSTNGMVAFAFWNENNDGKVFGNYIRLPFKRNAGKVNLDIDNYWLHPFYRTDSRFIAPIHVGLVFLVFFIMLIFRKKVKERAGKSLKLHSKIAFFLLRLVLWGIFLLTGYLVFLTSDQLYKQWFFNSSSYSNVGNIDTRQFIHHLTSSKSVVNQQANHLYWETYVKRKNTWEMKRLKHVLYFEVRKAQGKVESMKFLYDSDRLTIKSFQGKAQTHLIVYKVIDAQGNFIKEEVYNYAKVNITHKYSEPDPARRILVFVNGYRPVANGGTPEQALMQIGNNGVEFPNSSNVLFATDRFDYWRPWGNFDRRIIDRIKPNEVYYADGHHSVASSNHRSVFNFAKAAAEYPKACKGKHICKFSKTTAGTKLKTLDMLPFSPNKKGFNLRRKNGRIAGRNLYQLLNEVPGNSGNDTLFIVAHSMGYAYSLGIVESLRNKCVFGEYYIFAPENAETGKVIQSEWSAVYQYGSIPKGARKQAPCLQDGVAPQTKANGLSAQNRLTFPASHYKKMGFTRSHFIGFYDWVFEIPQGEKGAITQH
ncbi:MAG: hypothetical protein RL365_727 [Bacteroidota bacterium]